MPEVAFWEMRYWAEIAGPPNGFLLSARGLEMAGRTSAIKKNVMALDRLAVTIMVTDVERAELDAGASAVGLSFPQYIRTRCGWQVRQTSLQTRLSVIARRTTPGSGCDNSGWNRRGTSKISHAGHRVQSRPTVTVY